jgi:predicted O-methyltransferase YrrM
LRSRPTRHRRSGPREEVLISSDNATLGEPALAFAESYVPTDPILLHAMSWALELGLRPVTPGAGAVLRLLATASRAKSVVEIGTGTGVSGLWLLRGLRPDALLTSIDIEPEHQAMARQSFAAAGFAPGRARLIAGAAREVLPRLADGAYDLVFVDCDIAGYARCVSAAHRLLREGGLLVVNNALGAEGGGVDAELTGAESLILRELVTYLRDAPEWTPALIRTNAGLLCATRGPA